MTGSAHARNGGPPGSIPAFVLDLSPTGLGAVRRLARAGVPVRGFDCQPAREGFRSRYGRPTLCPDPTVDPDALLAFLARAAAAEPGKPFLLPANDKFALFVSERREELARSFSFVLPPKQLFEALLSKEGTYDLAARAGVRVPRSVTVKAGTEGVAALADGRIPADFPFPALLKPSLSFILWGVTRGKVVVVRDRAEAVRVLAALPAGRAFVLQEIVPGEETRLLFYSTYRDRDGRTLAEFLSRKIRQYPPGFGTSTMFETCRDEDLLEVGRGLFDRLGYHGLVSSEWKRDPRDGKLTLIEVNTRLWLFHPFSVPVGVDFVLTAYRDATGQAVEPQVQAPEVFRWQNFPLDLVSSYFFWRTGRLSLSGWLRSTRGPRCEMLWDWRDMGPFFRKLGRQAGQALRRLGRANGPAAVPELSWAEQFDTLDRGGARGTR